MHDFPENRPQQSVYGSGDFRAIVVVVVETQQTGGNQVFNCVAVNRQRHDHHRCPSSCTRPPMTLGVEFAQVLAGGTGHHSSGRSAAIMRGT